MKRHPQRQTLYALSAETLATRERCEADTVARARERGCQCIRPTITVVYDENVQVVYTYIEHDPWCPVPASEDAA